MDLNRRLSVCRGGEHLALAGRNGGVPLDQLGEDMAFCFQTQAQGRHVQQQNVLDFTAENTALDGRADGDAFIRVNALEGLLAGYFLHGFLNRGNTGAAADKDHLVDLVNGQSGVFQRFPHRFNGCVHQVRGQLIELGLCQGHVKVLRSGGVRRNERQVDIGGCRAAQFDLGLFSRFLQALGRDLVLFQVNAVFLLELFGNIVNDPLVEVITAKARIAVGAQHFKHAVADVQNAHVEGAAAQVVYQDLLVLFLVKSVSQ